MLWCQPIPLLFSTNAAEQSWACIPPLLTTDLTPHKHTHTRSHVTHTHTHSSYHTHRGAESQTGDATGWQPLSKSTLSFLCSLFLSFFFFFLCLSLLWLPFYDPSEFIYLSHSPLSLWNSQCFLRGRLFKLFSQYALHTPFSPLLSSPVPAFLSFFSLHVSGGRSKSPDLFACWRRARAGCFVYICE